MTTQTQSSSREVRSRLSHPIIDADGHQVEFAAPLEDYVKAIGGNSYAVHLSPALNRRAELDEFIKDTRPTDPGHSAWWHSPTKNTLDRATAALPKLLYERLDDIGLDFTVLIDTVVGMEVHRIGSEAQVSWADPEARQVRNRAINAYRADICRDYSDRMTPVARVTMENPQVAIEDLEEAINGLGMKTIQIYLPRRPVPAVHRRHPELYPNVSWLDNLALGSAYDYDPFWAKCVELKVPILSHSSGLGFTCHNTPSNYMYNHMGHFAQAGEALCKALFLGGVTRRFPTLKFGFLEGGVAWACRLYNDLISHWQKRSGEAIHNYNPANLDRELFKDLHTRYGGKMVEGRLDQVLKIGSTLIPEEYDPAVIDEFASCQIQREEDIRDLFVPNFFFGCEADDPTNALAFNEQLLPFGAHLNPVFGSDIGHWDVPDMTKVLEEAYELVDRGLLTKGDFRDFTFTNPVKLFTGTNPDFFKGTVVEGQVEKLLGSSGAEIA